MENTQSQELTNLLDFLKKMGYSRSDSEAFAGVDWYVRTYLHKDTIYDSGLASEKQNLKNLIQEWFNSIQICKK